MSSLIFLMGRPGVGKTSVLCQVAEGLKAKGYSIGGMISRECRERGVRIGFEIVDLSTGRKGWLAHIRQSTGPRVGRYRVNLDDLYTVGVESILRAINEAEIIFIDEIGPMELLASKFKDAVIQGMKSGKPIIGIIHYRAKNSLIDAIKTEERTEILEITQENRDYLASLIINKVLEHIEK